MNSLVAFEIIYLNDILIATLQLDNTVKIWNIDSGEELYNYNFQSASRNP